MRYHKHSTLKLTILFTILSLDIPSAWGKNVGIGRLRTQLEEIHTQLTGIDLKNDQDSPGAIDRRIKTLFTNAEQAYSDKEYLATIRIFNEVLSRSTQLDIDLYLRAQYLLARSYEELNQPSKAIRANLRYISSFTSQKNENYKQLIEVIRRTLILQEKTSEGFRENLYRLLSTLMSIPLPKGAQQEITLLSAISAYHAERYEMASPWLRSLDTLETPPKIKAEAYFYEALTAFGTGDDDKAEKALLKIMALSDPATGITQDLAALNLARLYAAKNLPQHAWDWYQRVEGPGLSLRLAAYEAVVLLMQSHEYDKALKIAHAYVKHFPGTKEAYRLQEWINYLEMRSGNLTTAENKLQNRDKNLGDLQVNLLEDYAGKDKVDNQDLVNIRNRTEIMALYSPIIEESQKLFERLDQIDRNILTIAQHMRSMTYTLGKVADPRLRPEVQAANTQFRAVMGSLFEVGETLLKSEQKLYANKLNSAEELSLSRSRERRLKIYEIDKTIKKNSWKTWEKLLISQARTGKQWEELEKQRLSLQNIIWRGYKPQSLPLEQERAKQAEDLLKQNSNAQQDLSLLMEDIRLQILDSTKSPSVLRTTRKLLLLASQEFIDSAHLLEKYRDDANHPLEKEEQLEYAKAWVTWQTISGKILLKIKADESEQKEWLEAQMKEIENIKNQHRKLFAYSQEMRSKLQTATARSLPYILDDFQYHIRQQQSRANKWLADLQWQRFVLQTEEKMKAKADVDKEETEVKEGLKDLEIERTLHE